MDKYFELMILGSIFLLGSCFSTVSSMENPLELHHDETITVLFSDSSTMQDEKAYYDALLELKNHYPTEMPFLLIIDADERDAIRYFNIEHFPTMLVITGDHEDLRMEGILSKDEILGHLVEVYRLESEAMINTHLAFNHTYKTPLSYDQ
ncbi:hypothetical protein N0O92_03010 [Alkalihalobacillus sp. MEB130]|uniref:hypothetical protein n=1 Tax=Alkalihalobacillus sp. MEB130 TaxID=2976704 RepID=UPI0028DFE0C7|nr:hypothetical protein [Alkalihalobacillus sp. MEB130]MDT8859188.1 hypothetical protein [Alkalihalobacillus sp. MEB130]